MSKTAITLAAFKILREQGLAERMLIIAPLRPALSVWPREIAKWEDFNDLHIDVLHGPEKQEKLEAGAEIQVINPEGLPWLFSQRYEDWPWSVLVCDESTVFKHTSAKRFKLLKPHLAKFRRRYILTGSPAPNGLLDLFGQVYILDLGNALGRYITHYRRQYFDPTGYGGYTWLPRAGSVEAIQEKLKPLTLHMAAGDYLDLPPLVKNTVEVVLPEKARRAYYEMENLLLAELEQGIVTAANAAAATVKCRQIANGGLYQDDASGRRKWIDIHEAKTEAVTELVEELSGVPALVAYEFLHDRERLNRAFPNAPYLGGGVTPREQREIEDGWCSGSIPVLLAQPQSVAHGLNLQGTHASIIFHSLTFDLEIYEQFIRRVWRQGQKERVIVHHVVAKSTVDEIIMQVLMKKAHTQGSLLEALKSYFKRRAA